MGAVGLEEDRQWNRRAGEPRTWLAIGIVDKHAMDSVPVRDDCVPERRGVMGEVVPLFAYERNDQPCPLVLDLVLADCANPGGGSGWCWLEEGEDNDQDVHG